MIFMKYLPERLAAFCGLAFLSVLGGCSAGKPECDSIETRNAVLQIVSNDSNNPLAKYAAENPNAAKLGDGSPEAEKSNQPVYLLGEKIVTTSTSADKRTLKCSGAISATVGGTRASKDVNFTVQQAPDGKISVSVDPFRF